MAAFGGELRDDRFAIKNPKAIGSGDCPKIQMVRMTQLPIGSQNHPYIRNEAPGPASVEIFGIYGKPIPVRNHYQAEVGLARGPNQRQRRSD